MVIKMDVLAWHYYTQKELRRIQAAGYIRPDEGDRIWFTTETRYPTPEDLKDVRLAISVRHPAIRGVQYWRTIQKIDAKDELEIAGPGQWFGTCQAIALSELQVERFRDDRWQDQTEKRKRRSARLPPD